VSATKDGDVWYGASAPTTPYIHLATQQ